MVGSGRARWWQVGGRREGGAAVTRRCRVATELYRQLLLPHNRFKHTELSSVFKLSENTIFLGSGLAVSASWLLATLVKLLMISKVLSSL